MMDMHTMGNQLIDVNTEESCLKKDQACLAECTLCQFPLIMRKKCNDLLSLFYWGSDEVKSVSLVCDTGLDMQYLPFFFWNHHTTIINSLIVKWLLLYQSRRRKICFMNIAEGLSGNSKSRLLYQVDKCKGVGGGGGGFNPLFCGFLSSLLLNKSYFPFTELFLFFITTDSSSCYYCFAYSCHPFIELETCWISVEYEHLILLSHR